MNVTCDIKCMHFYIILKKHMGMSYTCSIGTNFTFYNLLKWDAYSITIVIWGGSWLVLGSSYDI